MNRTELTANADVTPDSHWNVIAKMKNKVKAQWTLRCWMSRIRNWRLQRSVEKTLRRVALDVPCSEAMIIVTRWRWDISQANDIDETLQNNLLKTVETVEGIVKERIELGR